MRPLQVYQQLGLLAGSEQFPAVASFATVAGPSDSTYVLFGLSLPNSALRFQREGNGFIGRYNVTLTFLRDSVKVKEVAGRQEVRVASFAETGRTDESVVYQTAVALSPGRYLVELEARDGSGGRGFKTQDTLEVPAYGTGQRMLTSPVFVYRAAGRNSAAAAPDLIVNPRHTVPYGGEAPRVYLEAYGYAAGEQVQVRVVGDDGKSVWEGAGTLQEGGAGVAHALLEIPSAQLPLGRFWLESRIGQDAPAQRVPLVVTISDQWMVANFEEVLEFIDYIALKAEADSLRDAPPEERTERWERFWARRDPVPATPVNEFREEFFERIRVATLLFSEPGRPGWKTDRGEVYIVLGPPDRVIERRDGRSDVVGRPTAYEWLYERGPGGRLNLLFVDRTGFERYELNPASESAFRAAANRLKQRR